MNQCIIWSTALFDGTNISKDSGFDIETIADFSPYIRNVTKPGASTEYEVYNPRAGGKYTA